MSGKLGSVLFLLVLLVGTSAAVPAEENLQETSAQAGPGELEQASPQGEEVTLRFKSGQAAHCWLTAVHGDSVLCSTQNGTVVTYPVDSLSAVYLVRHGSLKRPAISAAVAGFAGALIGFMQGDDPPGWFSMTAEQKATLLGVGAATLAFETVGIYELTRATDVRVPLAYRSLPEKRAILTRVTSGTYRPPRPVESVVLVRLLKLSDEGMTPGVEIRLQSPVFKPTSGLGIVVCKTRWSPIGRYGVSYTYDSNVGKEKYRISYSGPYFFLSGHRDRQLIPWLSIGACFGTYHHWVYWRYHSLDPETGVEQIWIDTHESTDSFFALDYQAGVSLPLRPWLLANVSVGLMLGIPTGDGAPYTVAAGLQARLPL